MFLYYSAKAAELCGVAIYSVNGKEVACTCVVASKESADAEYLWDDKVLVAETLPSDFFVREERPSWVFSFKDLLNLVNICRESPLPPPPGWTPLDL